MPANNSLKLYVENGYYHVYNRGTGKNKIFKDDQDFKVFIHLLKKILSGTSRRYFKGAIKLIAYCLMPNHFHLFIHQENKNGMEKFIRSLCTSYSMYFNKRHDRSGTLFQGRYKAVLIEDENYFLHLSRYIHLNPTEVVKNWKKYSYSSYQDYIGERKSEWLDPSPVLAFFRKRDVKSEFGKYLNYENFVECCVGVSRDELEDLSID